MNFPIPILGRINDTFKKLRQVLVYRGTVTATAIVGRAAPGYSVSGGTLTPTALYDIGFRTADHIFQINACFTIIPGAYTADMTYTNYGYYLIRLYSVLESDLDKIFPEMAPFSSLGIGSRVALGTIPAFHFVLDSSNKVTDPNIAQFSFSIIKHTDGKWYLATTSSAFRASAVGTRNIGRYYTFLISPLMLSDAYVGESPLLYEDETV